MNFKKKKSIKSSAVKVYILTIVVSFIIFVVMIGLTSTYLMDKYSESTEVFRNEYLISISENLEQKPGDRKITEYVLKKRMDIPPPDFSKSIFNVIIVFLVFFSGGQFFVFIFFLKKILRPMDQMKEAANEISNGNLDYNVEYGVDDEIGCVFEAFENMRQNLKESHEKQQAYDTNRKELISNISHDLKTPITSIKGYSEGIIDGVANTPEKINKYVKVISNNANIMDDLIDDLFLMSKLDLDSIEFDFQTILANNYFQDYFEEVKYELNIEDIEFSYKIASVKDEKIRIDINRFARTMTNVMNNSKKNYDKDVKKLMVEIDKGKLPEDLIQKNDKEYIVIKFIDNGRGIPKNQIDKVFNRFYRADESRDVQKGGSGIGLSIVKKIIDSHNGYVKIESELGFGTVVTIYLPVEKEI